jgi:tRNA pseudouridine38-40 synthase
LRTSTGFKLLATTDTEAETAAAELAAEGFSRIALGVEYKGSRYSGWQRQLTGVLTVQETLENACRKSRIHRCR